MVKMVKQVLLTAVLLAPGVGAAAQTPAVTGVVVDADGRALAQAQVVLWPAGQQSLTGADGRFRLRLPGPGEYRVQVSLIGYAPVTQRVTYGGGALAPLELRLQTSPLTLSGIEATSSPLARQPSAVAQSTAQLSGRALERELSGTIAQTLKYQPGIAVRFNGPAAALPVLRGLTGDRVLMLQDGQRTADLAGSADDHGVTIDPLAAQRVEVVRGPATLLYGNNALGGVVNVISGDVSGGQPLTPQYAFAAQTESAYPGVAASARAAVPVGEAWSVTARASVRQTGDMRIAEDPELGRRLRNTDHGSRSGALTVARTARQWTGSLALRLYDFGYGIPVPPMTDEVDLAGARAELAGRVELELGSERLPALRVDGTAQRYAHDELDADAVVQQRFELATHTAGVLLRQAALGPFREGAWGASLLVRDYAATGPAALTPGADSRALGLFGFQELALGGRVAVQAGARVDRYVTASDDSPKFGDGVRRTFQAWSGSVGVVTTVHEGLTASVTASRSFRAPTVEELFSGAPHAGTGSVEYGDPGLREERGAALEAMLRLRASRLQGQAALYVHRIDDYVHLRYQADTVIAGAALPVYRYTQTPAVLTGAEGQLELALHEHVAVAVRGDWLHAVQDDGTPLSYMPPPRLGLSGRWDDGRFSFGADAHHELAQRRTGSAEEAPTHAHTILRLDAGARIRIAGHVHSLSLRVDNLTDQLHREATSRIKDFAPAAGRNIALAWRVHL